MVRFDDELELDGDGQVDAHGPLDPSKEEMLELCAWVFQRRDSDAAVTEMSTTGGKLEFPTGKWRMVLGTVGDGRLTEGEAFAIAVALMKDRATANQRLLWWGHPVTLVAAPAAS